MPNFLFLKSNFRILRVDLTINLSKLFNSNYLKRTSLNQYIFIFICSLLSFRWKMFPFPFYRLLNFPVLVFRRESSHWIRIDINYIMNINILSLKCILTDFIFESHKYSLSHFVCGLVDVHWNNLHVGNSTYFGNFSL